MCSARSFRIFLLILILSLGKMESDNSFASEEDLANESSLDEIEDKDLEAGAEQPYFDHVDEPNFQLQGTAKKKT